MLLPGGACWTDPALMSARLYMRPMCVVVVTVIRSRCRITPLPRWSWQRFLIRYFITYSMFHFCPAVRSTAQVIFKACTLPREAKTKHCSVHCFYYFLSYWEAQQFYFVLCFLMGTPF